MTTMKICIFRDGWLTIDGLTDHFYNADQHHGQHRDLFD